MSVAGALMKGIDIGKPIGASLTWTAQGMKHDPSKGIQYAEKFVKEFGSNYRLAQRKLAAQGRESNRGVPMK